MYKSSNVYLQFLLPLVNKDLVDIEIVLLDATFGIGFSKNHLSSLVIVACIL